jgi:hypothetical protein
MGRWIKDQEQTPEYRDAVKWYWSKHPVFRGIAKEKMLCVHSLWIGHQGVSVFFLDGNEYRWLANGLLDILQRQGSGFLADAIKRACLELYTSEMPPKQKKERLRPFDGPDEERIREIIRKNGHGFHLPSGMSSRESMCNTIDRKYAVENNLYMACFSRLCREIASGK